MGIKLFSSCSCTPIRIPNPDPKNFTILKIFNTGYSTVLKVKYKECTNYEGIKILVYKGNVINELLSAKELDPHFCEKHLSPIARFLPTEEGLKLALSLKL